MIYDTCIDCGGRTIGDRCGPCKRARERAERALRTKALRDSRHEGPDHPGQAQEHLPA